jgi:glycosyltransferase involved in cell wall biosynthesis
VSAAAVGICLATHEPDRELFAVQVDSIRGQTHDDWVCVVSDDASGSAGVATIESVLGGDPRFVLSRSPERLGFYRNFERALTLLPDGPGLVAFADQDDRWHPDKLEALAAALGAADLVHSDARIIDRDGGLISPTYWTGRRPNQGDLASLLVANTVTGAASLFRRELLRRALPFPELPGRPYHDQWLAAVALARGEIAYVDRPLYDYVQHEAAVLGHVGSGERAAERAPGGRRARWRAAYEEETRRVVLMAEALALRCEPLPDPSRRDALHRLSNLERSPAAVAWLTARALRESRDRTETAGAERTLLAGLLWHFTHRRETSGRP